jgi:hypothetical protein
MPLLLSRGPSRVGSACCAAPLLSPRCRKPPVPPSQRKKTEWVGQPPHADNDVEQHSPELPAFVRARWCQPPPPRLPRPLLYTDTVMRKGVITGSRRASRSSRRRRGRRRGGSLLLRRRHLGAGLDCLGLVALGCALGVRAHFTVGWRAGRAGKTSRGQRKRATHTHSGRLLRAGLRHLLHAGRLGRLHLLDYACSRWGRGAVHSAMHSRVRHGCGWLPPPSISMSGTAITRCHQHCNRMAAAAKMASGVPLTDGDRWPWLDRSFSSMQVRAHEQSVCDARPPHCV